VPVYGFDEDSARRIGQTVRLVEGSLVGDRNKKGAVPAGNRGSVRCMLGTIGGSAWDKNSSSTVTIYTGEPGNETSAETVNAYNYVADVPASIQSSRWVSVSHNGYGWLLIEGPRDFFRKATFSGDWEVDSTATVTFSGVHSGETATAINSFCSIAGGDVGLCQDSDGVWNLVSWEMEEVCQTSIVNITVELNTTTCAIDRTLVTAAHRLLRLTDAYADCP